MESKTDEAIATKFCPLIKGDCLEDGCVFWVRSTDMVRKNCAVVLIAQQLNSIANKSQDTRLT